MLSVMVFGYEENSTSSVRPIAPHSISMRQQQACCRQRQQVRGEGDGACTHGLTYYTQVVASGAGDGGLLRSVAAGRKKQQGCGETC